MKHHSAERPIGKCKGCCLNLRTQCAAGVMPKDEWARGRCRSWNDADALDAFLNAEPPVGAELAKLARRRKAAAMRTEPHHDGLVFVPARSAGAPGRRP